MGILNLTPDSFSDGGQYTAPMIALRQAEKMIRSGADIIDIGAQSTRPNAELLPAATEISRIGRIIKEMKQVFPQTLISLDTFYAETVRFGFDQGIDLINDISGGMYDSEMLSAVAATGLPYILMHVNETYQTMHSQTKDGDIVLRLNRYFSQKTRELAQLGIHDVVLDPGFGFGKTVAQQHEMIDELSFIGFGTYPVLAGISRKSFIYKPLGKTPHDIAKETHVLHLKLLQKGANILRVHDVAATAETIRMYRAL